MHNHYYFLRQLSAQLQEALPGFTLVSCFSQEKDELVIEFNNARRSFFLKCTLRVEIQCLSFPGTFRRARKNSVDLFTEIVMRKVNGVRQFRNERSFALQFDDGFSLVFKMHGPQANVLLFQGESVVSIFRNHLPADRSLSINSLDREIDWSVPGDPVEWRKRFFTFGKAVWEYLDRSGFATAASERQWKMIGEVRNELENPRFYLVESGGKPKLSLLPDKSFTDVFDDPFAAVNTFFVRYVSKAAFDREKAILRSSIESRISQAEAYLAKASKRLEELNEDQHYARWADLVMANLHVLSPGMAEAQLQDFHNPEQLVTVRLKKELSPQKNAEVLYRKAKNQAIEKKKLTEAIALREKDLMEWTKQKQLIQAAQNREELAPLAALSQHREKEKKAISLPYHEHVHLGYTILVGKNAEANDKLTLRHAHKEDLWLHARDVAGSHVVIKHQSGKNFPKDVVAFAASLAAYHSKRRNDTLCPVSVTEVRYVRKRKGDPAGMVVVQREKVIMAEPLAGRSKG